MIVLAGATLVLPDRLLERASLLIDDGRIAAIEARIVDGAPGAARVDLSDNLIVPGFVDVHVHGVEGHDVLDGPGAVSAVAARLPRYGVTAFCPTSIACAPPSLDRLLVDVEAATADSGAASRGESARVIGAHLESNFINPAYNGAQPIECLRSARWPADGEGHFTGAEIIDIIERHRPAVGIVTIAPEIDGGLELVTRLANRGIRVSIGHSGATYEQALAAIDAGVTHATHLFNRMSPMSHRAPGVPGAVLTAGGVRTEVICDGLHVHPSIVQLAVQAKGTGGVMAITDGTAGSGLSVGSRTRLGGRPIVVTSRTAELEVGTIAGSVLTMDGAFRMLVGRAGASLVDAARMCATTPADQLGLNGLGRIAVGAGADLAVLDSGLRIHSTYIAGRRWTRNTAAPGDVYPRTGC
jgi:N-acetylglucosamine-6-phosphate deacetylase